MGGYEDIQHLLLPPFRNGRKWKLPSKIAALYQPDMPGSPNHLRPTVGIAGVWWWEKNPNIAQDLHQLLGQSLCQLENSIMPPQRGLIETIPPHRNCIFELMPTLIQPRAWHTVARGRVCKQFNEALLSPCNCHRNVAWGQCAWDSRNKPVDCRVPCCEKAGMCRLDFQTQHRGDFSWTTWSLNRTLHLTSHMFAEVHHVPSGRLCFIFDTPSNHPYPCCILWRK